MKKSTRIGIIICDRYRNCAGGKCFRSLKNREGAFDIYSKEEDVELVGYTTCGGCPGGNFEYVPDEMKKNGADTIHFATGLIVGYPPCPYINYFKKFIEEKYQMNVVLGTHPIPEKYYLTHLNLGTWKGKKWDEIIKPALANKDIRIAYN